MLFVLEEEKALYDAISAHNADNKNIDEYILSLKTLVQPIVQFFDKVLVMDKDEKIKNNRIALLTKLKSQYEKLADFTKLQALQ